MNDMNALEIIITIMTTVLSLVAIGVSIWAVIVAKRSHIEAKRATAMETAEQSIQYALGRATHYKFEDALEFVEQANSVASRVPKNVQALIERTERLVRGMSARYSPTLDAQARMIADTAEGNWWRDANGEMNSIYASLENQCKKYWKT
jgi:hypothetical protein